jgi:hypothetical protein
MKHFYKFPSFVCLLIVSFILLGCSKEDSSDIPTSTPIYQDLKVKFDMTKSESQGLATFRVENKDGNRLELSGGASIQMNEENIPYTSNITNYFYRKTVNTITDIRFYFTNNNGESFSNEIKATNRSELVMTNPLDTVRLDGSSEINWKSNPLEPNESIQYSIHQGNKSGGAGYYAQSGATSVEIGSIIVGGLKIGIAELHISREKIIAEIDQGDGANSNGRYVLETAIIHPIYLIE